jgi:hypothetical protein
MPLELATLHAPANAAETRPYDVRACGVQVLEALAQREHVPRPASISVHEAPTLKLEVSLMVENSLTTPDECAVSLMARDGLTVHDAPTRQYAVPQDLRSGLALHESNNHGSVRSRSGEFPIQQPMARGDQLISAEVFLDTGRRVQQTTAAHAVPRSLTSVSEVHDTTPAKDCSTVRPTDTRDGLSAASPAAHPRGKS